MGMNQYPRRGKAQITRLPVTTTSLTSATLTLDQQQAEYIDLQSGASAGFTLQFTIYPADAGMWWFVRNQTSQTVTLKGYTTDGGTTPTTGVTLATAKAAAFLFDGTDFVQVSKEV